MHRLVAWVQGFAESLGGPGLFILAFLDSSFLSFPEVCDALIVILTVQFPDRMVFYAAITTMGSVSGCYTLYTVGRRGGEAFLRKRFHERHLDRALAVFRRYGVLAILVPSLLPPPMPFKIFVLAAGVARVRPLHFLLAVSLGRGLRYFGEGFLALWYGERALAFLKENAHMVALGLGSAVLVGGLLFLWWQKRAGRRRNPPLAPGGPGAEDAQSRL
jgi:membrane protein YqaA with SNARE-associated domain